MQDIIILEQCKVCNRHLILRESIQHENYKSYIVKYCSNGCIPVEEIFEIKENDNG